MVINATVKIVKAGIVKIDIISTQGKSDALHHMLFDAVLPASRGCIKEIGEFSENGQCLIYYSTQLQSLWRVSHKIQL